jgi:hypothetical protein
MGAFENHSSLFGDNARLELQPQLPVGSTHALRQGKPTKTPRRTLPMSACQKRREVALERLDSNAGQQRPVGRVQGQLEDVTSAQTSLKATTEHDSW